MESKEMVADHDDSSMEAHYKRAWEFFDSLGRPKYVCAPMVDQSELSFRMLCRNHGTQLCYTPMLHSRLTVEDKNYLPLNFSTCKEDRPLVVQFCGNEPDTLLAACQKVENMCDAVDINFGCPQGIAKKGNYGSFLLEKPQLVFSLVKKLADNLKIPVFCKIRILPDREKTMELVKGIQAAGCWLLTVHGRTKEQNKHLMGACDWDIIRDIKKTLKIPVFANGGIHKFEDVTRCIEHTGVDGVMSAESLLENPALFSGEVKCLDALAEEYIDLWEKYDSQHPKFLKPHLFKILHKGLSEHTDLRDKMGSAKGVEDCREIVKEMKERRKEKQLHEKFGWYERYQSYAPMKDLPADKGAKKEEKLKGRPDIEIPEAEKKLKVN